MIRVRSPLRKRKWSTARMGRGREGESASAAHSILSAVAGVVDPGSLTGLSVFGQAVARLLVGAGPRPALAWPRRSHGDRQLYRPAN